MRLTNVMMTNTTLMHINRNMRNLDKIIRQIETTKKIQKPSDDPIIASRALIFRTSVHETEQFKRNVDQGVAWMNVSESTFNNINSELLKTMRTLAVQGANGDNNLENMQAIIRQMGMLFDQLGHEINQTFGGNYLFSGFRTDEPPVFIEDNYRSFVITQTFNMTDVSRESSWQRLLIPGGIGTLEPESKNIDVLKLAYSGLDNIPVIPGFDVLQRSIHDDDAYIPEANNATGVPIIHYIAETGELVMHHDTSANFPREGISVTYQKTGFRQGDINPSVYFMGREITDLGTTHIPMGTELVYNVTQNLNRNMGTFNAGTNSYDFTLEYTSYAPTPMPDDLRALLSTGVNANITGNVVSVPAHVFETNRNITVTYPVQLNSPTQLGTHIMANTNVQGAELVRALNVDGVPVPLDTMELNKSFDMLNQEIQYEFAARTRITVNSLACNSVTDKMFADFRRFFEFADSIYISAKVDLEQHFRGQGYEGEDLNKAVEEQLAKENAMARDAIFKQFNNMLFLIDRHVDVSTREQTLLGARMVRMELVQNRLDDDAISYEQLTSDNEDTDMILAAIQKYSAEAAFQASLRANSGVVQMSLANFLR